jgi:serine phosphatase RsbU (regulator of sigma subunit)
MLGVFQAINKLNEESQFTKEDSKLFKIAISYISNILDVDHLAEENKYFIEEQTKAAQKQQMMLVNELENHEKVNTYIFFKPYDYLSGDSYSLHLAPDGSFLFYVLDAMGHGIVPSFTCLSVLSFVKKALNMELSFQELANEFGKSLEYILSDMEQLSASFFHLDKDFKYIEYFSAGMYPTLVQDGDKVHHLKANNIPFMNFFLSIKVDRVELEDFKKVLVYSDGITEDTRYYVDKDDMEIMLDIDILRNYFEVIKDKKMDDDVTAVMIEKKED